MSGGLQQDITVAENLFLGEDRTLQFTVTDAAGVVVNITGWTLQWKLEASQGGTALVTKTGTVTDGPNGVCTVTLAAADTVGLTAGPKWHVLARTDSGNASVLSYGAVALQSR
jgi:hypothetical protein